MGRQTGPGGARGVSEASPKPPGRLLTAPGRPGEMAKAPKTPQEAPKTPQETPKRPWEASGTPRGIPPGPHPGRRI